MLKIHQARTQSSTKSNFSQRKVQQFILTIYTPAFKILVTEALFPKPTVTAQVMQITPRGRCTAVVAMKH